MRNNFVIHFVRKNTQLRASFIQNQILNHSRFTPMVVYREKRNSAFNGGFATDIQNAIPKIDLSENETLLERILYKFFKTLSKRQKKILYAYFSKFQPVVMHFHYGTDAGIYLKSIRNLNVPKVVSFYGYDCFSFPKRFFGLGKYFLKNRVFPFADVVFAMTPEMEKDLKKIGCPENKIRIHYHGVPSNLTIVNRNYNNNKDVINLLMLSYLDPVKGHIFVVKALKYLIDRNFKNFRLIIAGDGHYKSEIQKCINDNNLNDYVVFIGLVKYLSKEYFNVFENADIFINTSVITKDDKEGIPGTIVEAMFAGLPIIATYHGGIPYVLKNEETGLLLKEWDIPALAEAIKELAQSSVKRMELGRKAKEFAINNFDLIEKEKDLEAIYQELIEKES